MLNHDFWKPEPLADEKVDEIAELLFQEVQQKYGQRESLPNRIILARLAKDTFGLGLRDSVSCVNKMEFYYEIELAKMNYSVHRAMWEPELAGTH